ncbi:MAG: hydrogen peroxide-dependent heme synthase [Bryobacteraceae bacterium]
MAAEPVMPPVPLTVEGSSVLHQMFRLNWAAWKATPAGEREAAVAEAVFSIAEMEQRQTALFSLLGHKGDLLFLHFRASFEELQEAELRLARLKLADYLEPTTSYLSVVELGLYDSCLRLYRGLLDRGLRPGSAEWDKEIEETLAQHRKAMAPRLYPSIPEGKYICFYPMDRRRGESVNWYTMPMAERRRMMHEHGEVGRKYAGQVKQIISGSIGLDDWEWGVDLFADDPVAFKKVIYEMRFDEASALYALFGPFYIGIRMPAKDLGRFLAAEAGQ